MRKVALLLAAAGACAPFCPAEEVQLRTLTEKASYSIGLNIGLGMKQRGVRLVTAAVVLGFNDGLSGAKPALSDKEAERTAKLFNKLLRASAKVRAAMLTEEVDPSRPLASFAGKASYCIGLGLGKGAKEDPMELSATMLARGLDDGASARKPLLSQEQARDVLVAFQRERVKRIARKNRKEGEAFLAENATKPGVKTLPSGLQYRVLRDGTGDTPKPTDLVATRYKGTLIDGTVFDTSEAHSGLMPFRVNGVIEGWTEALLRMKVGAKWQLFIPPDLAYGDQRPARLIPPGATLIFELELVRIK